MALLMLCLYMTNDEFSISGSLVLVVSGYNGGLKDFSQVVDISTGKSFSEALILASDRPQYDKRLFIKFPEKYKFTT